MKWRKLGLVYAPTGELWWAKSYAHLPTVGIISEKFFRVYFASLDNENFGRIGFVDLDIDDPTRILKVANEPVLNIGERGTFDDCGVNPSCIIDYSDQKYLYYIGWQRSERVPYMLFTGLAVSEDNGNSFRKYSSVPILDRTNEEPYSRSAPIVLLDDGILKMWYWSCLDWSDENGWIHYNNVIKYAESNDGVNWITGEDVCITPEGLDYAVGRPWVIKEVDMYKMWYSIRSRAKISYRIGYAESTDGVEWIRKGSEAGITVSETGWDSEMICYPHVVDIMGKRYIFYNGNRRGFTGFGCAVLESE